MRLIRTMIVSLAVCALFFSLPAIAETDLRKLKCSEFDQIMTSKDPKIELGAALIMGFLWGLYKDEDEPPIMGNESDNKKLSKLGKYCAENPNVNIIQAADKLWNED